ncbi:M48 family metalloprotease [Salinisphaera sp. Q1T1-3]|uniref:M48 family metalloprotease n=1 Tax=Salinisphaera sp. Q1T1-3 TaxID=2321229 RepID=UPI001314182A|nr:M48 family metalloprotease [Salinisphaera sp. Q1T1-3]
MAGSAGAISSDYNLPDLGDPADTAMSPAEKNKLGAQVVYQLREQGAIVNDPQLEAYINRIGKRLVAHTNKPKGSIHYYVIKQDEINSFALPGGNIGIFTGMMVQTDSESELASVMAHETAHEVQNHIARQLAESKGDTIATLATAIVAAIAGAQAGGGGDAAMAAIMGGMSHLGMQSISYTRANEYEADRVGIRILAASDYDPNAMSRFFAKLQRQSDLYGKAPPEILLTHPMAGTRMANAEERAAQYPNVPVHESAEYPYMRERARVLQANSIPVLLRYYRKRLSNGDKSPADYYGYALVLDQQGRLQDAIDILAPRAKAHPELLAWTLALASTETRAGNYHKASTLLEGAMKRFPDRDAAKLAYAENLTDQGRPGEMRNFMLSQPELLADYPQAQQLLARAAGDQHDLGEAYYRQARYYAMINDYPSAINQLRTALQTADLSPYNKSRLGALRDQMVSACHQAWSVAQCRQAVVEQNRY